MDAITTFMGLQNIDRPREILKKLYRVCRGFFCAACSFLPPEDSQNLGVLTACGADQLWAEESIV